MARSSGKIILLGEHAVVYGVAAIAAGIGTGARASAAAVTAGEPAALALGEQRVVVGDGSELSRAFAALLAALDAPPLVVQVALDLPPGCGLGASAAIGVAVARAVLAHRAATTPLAIATGDARDRVLAAANAWERVFHGNPSGIDAAAAAHGGVLLFKRGEAPIPLLLRRPLTLAIAIAGPPASTKTMVDGVSLLRQRRPEMVESTLRGIDALVRNARLHLEDGNLPELGKLLDLNQMLLSGLMVSTPEIERAVHVAREAGALGAKLTGSGGGGAVIALVDDPEPVLEAWRGAGFSGFATTVQPQSTATDAPSSA